MASENISSMEAAPETLDIAPEERRFRWASDNPLVRAVARVPLPIRAKQLFGAFAVAALLALAAEHRPDLILMDIRMPDLNGTEAVRKLREDERTAAIPVVALTSSTMKGDRERFLADGFDGYLEKPIRVREFPDQIRRHLAT